MSCTTINIVTTVIFYSTDIQHIIWGGIFTISVT